MSRRRITGSDGGGGGGGGHDTGRAKWSSVGSVALLSCCASLVVGGCGTAATAYRILAYEPSSAYSHWGVMAAVLESLVDAGHEVVCATPRPAAAAGRLAGHPNYTHVDVSAAQGDRDGSVRARDVKYSRLRSLFASDGYMIAVATDRAQRMCAALTSGAPGTDVYEQQVRGRFDVVVVESLFSECQWSSLPGRLRLPAVYVVPTSVVDWMPACAGSPAHPSYLGALLTGHPTPRTFFQRLRNAVVHVHTNLVRWYRDAGARSAEPRWPTAQDSIMVMVNTHHSVEPARPLGPNVREIGGIHLRAPIKPLPPKLLEILNKSREFGVIVFTLGSLVSMNSLPQNVLSTFKFVFSRLRQTVLWKYENSHMVNKPKNAILHPWLPQRDILHHPNVKLFISHGGMNGVYEAMDAGVPVLGIPLFYDQPRNVENLVDLGVALSLDIENMTAATMWTAINRLLEDRSFTENAKRVSSLFRDRPMTPSDSVVYWTEYLIRHGGAANIRPLAANESWISYFMIDLFAALTVTLLSIWFCARVVIRKVLKAVSIKAKKKNVSCKSNYYSRHLSKNQI